jgi:Icc-related predicted phosphoesterase
MKKVRVILAFFIFRISKAFMKIQIISDLHQEFGETYISFDHADVVILPGDINIGTKGIDWIKSKIKNKPVIYVLGNHEYYKGSYPKTLNKIMEIAKNSNVFVLENNSIDIDGIRFHGTTLWTDFSILGNPSEHGIICQDKMNDYKMIRRDPTYSKLRTIDTFKIHTYSRKWLEQSLLDSKSSRNIVITHHAPSIKSISHENKNNPLTAAYATNLKEFTLQTESEIWIHGHIHTPIKYNIGKTIIMCNPHGYIGEKYNGFEKELIVDI